MSTLGMTARGAVVTHLTAKQADKKCKKPQPFDVSRNCPKGKHSKWRNTYSRKSTKTLRTSNFCGIWTKTHSHPSPSQFSKTETPFQTSAAQNTALRIQETKPQQQLPTAFLFTCNLAQRHTKVFLSIFLN